MGGLLFFVALWSGGLRGWYFIMFRRCVYEKKDESYFIEKTEFYFICRFIIQARTSRWAWCLQV